MVRELPGDLVAQERRRPVGVIGANFEARPNVVADIASQLIKSRNAGVLRTGSAALRSAIALADEVVAPALADAGLDPAAIQLIRVPGQAAAYALVGEPGLIPLVILRGSGASTRALAFAAARRGVRTLAHADGGGVIYLDASADRERAKRLIETSLDRLGVCNRLNLLLVHEQLWDEVVPEVTALLDGLGVAASLPPHRHPLGHEWALDTGHEATVTIARAAGPTAAADIANDETSGLAAAIVTEDREAAGLFLSAYAGHRGLLERHAPPARRLQAAGRARDRDQHRQGARPARAGDLPRPVPAAVRHRAPAVTGAAGAVAGAAAPDDGTGMVAALLSAPGQEVLAQVAAGRAAGEPPLALASRLRRDFPAALVAAATTQDELRRAAGPKFSRAMRMLFTRPGLEQASSEAAARHRARRLAGAAPQRLADLGCGIGGDLIALAAGREVLAVDRDPVHLRMAVHNAGVYEAAAGVRTCRSDVRDVSLAGVQAAFADPARRLPGGGRPAAAGRQ